MTRSDDHNGAAIRPPPPPLPPLVVSLWLRLTYLQDEHLHLLDLVVDLGLIHFRYGLHRQNDGRLG